MDLGISGKTALVTASSKGLGRAVAERLLNEGANMAICARDTAALDATLADLRASHGDRVFAFPCDVTSVDQITALVATVRERFGRIDILVTNAGGPPPGRFLDVDSAKWQQAFELTLMSAVHLIRLCLPDMEHTSWGRVLLMASISAKQPLPNMVLSNSIRAGVIGMAKTLADEVADKGILVNVLCPGFIRTGRMEEVVQAQANQAKIPFDTRLEQLQQTIPVKRLGRPEEFANVAAFLVSDCASYMTGTTVLADGGLFRGLV